MASCSQYAAAFGYQLYIVPVSACGVDLGNVSGGVQAGGFIDPASPLDPQTKIEQGTAAQVLAGDPGADIVFDNDVVTTETVIRLYGLTNASLETDTGSETVTTYDTESKGFDQNVAVSKSWSLSLEGVSQFTDAGYKTLRLLEQNAVAGGLKVKVGRIGPTGTTEAIYGYATLTGFSESIEAGSIVSWSVTAEGYGPYAIDLDNSGTINLVGPIAGLGLTTGGSNLADNTYTDVDLTGGNGSGAQATIVVSGGVVTSVTLTEAGTGYAANDILSEATILGAANPNAGSIATISVDNAGANLDDGSYTAEALVGGNGSSATIDVTVSGGVVDSVSINDAGAGYDAADSVSLTTIPAAANPAEGEILTSSINDGGSGYADAVYSGVSLTGGNGSAALADITVSGGIVTDVTITDSGVDYVAGDQLSADDTDLGGNGGSGLLIDVDSVDENATLSATQPTFIIDSVAGATLSPTAGTFTVSSLVNDND